MKPNENQTLSDKKRKVKKKELEAVFTKMLEILDFDTDHPQISGTPKRMAKMYIDELFAGSYTPPPKMTAFPNDGYDKASGKLPVFLGPIQIKSMCSHHFLPFTGSAYIAYIPGKTVIGISKIARAVRWFMRRPQIQEELTTQLRDYLVKNLLTDDIFVHIEASHMCMTIRGVEEPMGSTMATTAQKGAYFMGTGPKAEFYSQVSRSKSK